MAITGTNLLTREKDGRIPQGQRTISYSQIAMIYEISVLTMGCV
jgi:hypothetical protein